MKSIQPKITLDEFQQTLHHPTPPAGLPPLLAALWWERKGDWSRGHEIAQRPQGQDEQERDESSAMAAWVHAYLHRKEGDDANAGYWYGQARRTASTLPLDEEWKEIVTALLDVSGA
ncbi:MAG: hypothetical protein ACR2JE_02355 [Acidobacteriaceae bacterium]